MVSVIQPDLAPDLTWRRPADAAGRLTTAKAKRESIDAWPVSGLDLGERNTDQAQEGAWPDEQLSTPEPCQNVDLSTSQPKKEASRRET